jgi:multimeric flavodoxin WrbA
MHSLCETRNIHSSSIDSLMTCSDHHRFIHFHGQYGGRFSSDQSIHGGTKQRPSPFFLFLNLFMFFAPYQQFNELKEIYVDKTVNYNYRWKAFIDDLKQDWNNFVVAVRIFHRGHLYH